MKHRKTLKRVQRRGNKLAKQRRATHNIKRKYKHKYRTSRKSGNASFRQNTMKKRGGNLNNERHTFKFTVKLIQDGAEANVYIEPDVIINWYIQNIPNADANEFLQMDNVVLEYNADESCFMGTYTKLPGFDEEISLQMYVDWDSSCNHPLEINGIGYCVMGSLVIDDNNENEYNGSNYENNYPYADPQVIQT